MKDFDSFMQSQYNEGFYSHKELQQIGFASIGKNVLLSRLAKIYGASKISLGNNVRIDDFVILSGKIEIGNFVHIGAFSSITGGNSGVIVGDFCNMSSYCKIFAVSDNFFEGYLAGSCIPANFRKLRDAQVVLERFNNFGSHSLALPESYFPTGSSLGPMSVNLGKKFEEWGYYLGNPARKLSLIDQNQVLKLEKEFLSSIKETMGGGDKQYQTITDIKRIAS
ncbi:acyltransferase [Helicobacter kayseriensis]|uniref:acyltransferase n=1 Tax=Helicobacter kayseriensis TaxID=2905877 RepID=UPI001E64BE3C|nr:galactoside O-acetyltransferase [Helicobacter kayseriensis]MCE3046674.1 galactoside O-acetyltransferase [Helicobacter kayseriensis]MCE3048024.1 galactoside O-acetyltransferase [Helicobacter kayseriensis]